MKIRVLILGLMVLGLSSCDVHNTDNIDIDTNAIRYVKDSRTGLCFALTASRKSFDANATGLGLTCVPCKDVEHLIGK
jgi:hypothetical protein